jgi:hypothetical protein
VNIVIKLNGEGEESGSRVSITHCLAEMNIFLPIMFGICNLVIIGRRYKIASIVS